MPAFFLGEKFLQLQSELEIANFEILRNKIRNFSNIKKYLKNLIHAFQVVFLAEQDDNVPGFKSFQRLGIENHLPG